MTVCYSSFNDSATMQLKERCISTPVTENKCFTQGIHITDLTLSRESNSKSIIIPKTLSRVLCSHEQKSPDVTTFSCYVTCRTVCVESAQRYLTAHIHFVVSIPIADKLLLIISLRAFPITIHLLPHAELVHQRTSIKLHALKTH